MNVTKKTEVTITMSGDEGMENKQECGMCGRPFGRSYQDHRDYYCEADEAEKLSGGAERMLRAIRVLMPDVRANLAHALRAAQEDPS
jgi:hypothetical protein